MISQKNFHDGCAAAQDKWYLETRSPLKARLMKIQRRNEEVPKVSEVYGFVSPGTGAREYGFVVGSLFSSSSPLFSVFLDCSNAFSFVYDRHENVQVPPVVA
jgi:hypothetical protein